MELKRLANSIKIGNGTYSLKQALMDPNMFSVNKLDYYFKIIDY
jgi:hypothetical protein